MEKTIEILLYSNYPKVGIIGAVILLVIRLALAIWKIIKENKILSDPDITSYTSDKNGFSYERKTEKNNKIKSNSEEEN